MVFLSQRDEGIDAVLLDLNLPDSDYAMTLKSITKLKLKAPVIVLTSVDMSKGLEAIRNGAQDFINKDSIDKAYLEYKIIFAIERSSYIKHLEKVAFINPVTGLYTLKYLEYLLGTQNMMRETVGGLIMVIVDTQYALDDERMSGLLEEEIQASFKYIESRLGISYASDQNQQYVFVIDDHEHKYAYFMKEVERLFDAFLQEHQLSEIRYGIGMYELKSEGFYDLLELAVREVKYETLHQLK